LSDADRTLCDYAVKLTLAPGKMTERDLQVLRDASFDDAQITVAAQVIGYFNYINRIADGLGVDPEVEMTLPIDEWRAKKGVGYEDDLA
jgi:alkylhydroperoxidase family enzyme